MNLAYIRTSVLLALIMVGVRALWGAARQDSPKSPVPTGLSGPETAFLDVQGYKKWTVVNEEPFFVPNYTLALCVRRGPSPHEGGFIAGYVNDHGKKAMLEQKMPFYPVGSVVVKEKLSSKDAKTADLLTVMLKREKGYNPRAGDWEFATFDGKGMTLQEHGKIARCMSCHNSALKDEDYVFRTYLPKDRRLKLK